MQNPSRKLKLIALVVLLAVSWQLLAPGSASAAGAKPGIEVSPGQLNFSLSKDSAQQVVPVTITNGYDGPVTLTAQFNGIDENAGLLIPTDSLDPNFASTLRVSDTVITLAAHETRLIQVQASNPATLSPGGHYATLVLTQKNTGSTKLSLNAAISLSLFVVKVAGANPQLSLSNFNTNGWLFKQPTEASLTFNNTGNVHVVPRGVVNVLDGKFNVLAKGIANQESLPLLPGKTVTTKVAISRLANTWKPQKLLVWTAYRIDGQTAQTVVRRTIWYIPPFYPLALLLLVIVSLLTRRWWWPRLRRSAGKLRSKLPWATAKTDLPTTAPTEALSGPETSAEPTTPAASIPPKKVTKPKPKPTAKKPKTRPKKSGAKTTPKTPPNSPA